MYNLEFKVKNCDGMGIVYQYYNPLDFLSLVRHGDDEKSMGLPMLDDEVKELKYYGRFVDRQKNNINIVDDVYRYCEEKLRR